MPPTLPSPTLQALLALSHSPLLPPNVTSSISSALQPYSSAASSSNAFNDGRALRTVLGQAESSFKQGGKEAELKSLQELMLRVDAELKEVEEVEEKEEESMGHQIKIESNIPLSSPSAMVVDDPLSSPSQAATPSSTQVRPQPSNPSSIEPSSSIPPALLPLIISSLSANPLPSEALPSSSSSDDVKALRDATLLTTLSLKPTLVLPPGKTLHSLLAQPSPSLSSSSSATTSAQADAAAADRERKRKRLSASGPSTQPPAPQSQQQQTLEERVGAMMKLAFWDDALQKLLSSHSSATRLAGLKGDLAVACSGLLGPGKVSELFVVPDTQREGFNVQRFGRTLGELLAALKAQAAPVRDARFDALQSTLSSALSLPPSPTSTKDATRELLGVVQGTFDLAEDMKADLKSFAINSISPSSLPALIRTLAQTTERSAITSAFGPIDTLQPSVASWKKQSQLSSSSSTTTATSSSSATIPWQATLVQCLLSPHAISLPTSTPASTSLSTNSTNEDAKNLLPPILLAVSSVLFHLQNYLQAVIITASLLLLIPKHSSSPFQLSTPDASFQEPASSSSSSGAANKLLSLLLTDLTSPGSAQHTSLSDLHLILLSSFPPSIPPPDSLEASIKRILNTSDPVWGLLSARLRAALQRAVLTEGESVVPGVMSTGRGTVGGGGGSDGRKGGGKRRVQVQGFEGVELEERVGEVVDGLRDVVKWVGEVWGDVVNV